MTSIVRPVNRPGLCAAWGMIVGMHRLVYHIDQWLMRLYCGGIWHHRGQVEYFTGYAECQRCFKTWPTIEVDQ